MFSVDEVKEIPGSFMRPGDEIISIQEVCLTKKLDRKDLGLHLMSPTSSTSNNEVGSHDSFFPESYEQARFAWTEEDGNIASLVSQHGFGTTGHTDLQIDSALKNNMKEADTSSSAVRRQISKRNNGDSSQVSSTTSGNSNSGAENAKQRSHKVDKEDPRSRFHFLKYVKRHGKTIKLWECGICSREFQHQYTLMRHLPTHTDERNFHCKTCGKSFRQLSTLSQHRAIHSTDRPYACEVCNKTFNRVSTLISHRKTHSNDKPYKCHMCPKGFHQKGNLRNHLFTHTNERPYRCNICFKGFNQQSNLVCHKNKAHPEDGSGSIILSDNQSSNAVPTKQNNTCSNSDCEVTSSIEPISNQSWPKSPWVMLPSPPLPWKAIRSSGPCSRSSSSEGWNPNGVVVDAIKTRHMEVAVATKQVPFALLKPDEGSPVLVKVVDTSLPGGKQMLVPATAEDLKSGGKIVMKKEDSDEPMTTKQVPADTEGSVQIRVPVVATVVPRVSSVGRLQLAVERAYHTALSTDLAEVKVEPCSPKPSPEPTESGSSLRQNSDVNFEELHTENVKDFIIPACNGVSCRAASLSPPLDLIPLDLFEPMECMHLGSQIIAIDSIDQSSHSNDSDKFKSIFEVKF